MATIYDKEIVLYIASLMSAKIEGGEDVAQDFLFIVADANHSAQSDKRRSEALERLQETQIKTNIKADGEPPRVYRRPFGLSYAAMGWSSSMA